MEHHPILCLWSEIGYIGNVFLSLIFNPQKCPKIKPANAPLDGEAGTVVSQVVPLVPDPVVVVDLVLPEADMSNSIKSAIAISGYFYAIP